MNPTVLISDEAMLIYALATLGGLVVTTALLARWGDPTALWYVVLLLGQVLFVWYFLDLTLHDQRVTELIPLTAIATRPGLVLWWLGSLGKAYSRIRAQRVLYGALGPRGAHREP